MFIIKNKCTYNFTDSLREDIVYEDAKILMISLQLQHAVLIVLASRYRVSANTFTILNMIP